MCAGREREGGAHVLDIPGSEGQHGKTTERERETKNTYRSALLTKIQLREGLPGGKRGKIIKTKGYSHQYFIQQNSLE